MNHCEYCGAFVAANPTAIHICNYAPVKEQPKNTGDRHNAGKPRWRNFPMFLMEPLVHVGSAAEKHPGNPNGKYDTFNFLKGQHVNDLLDCAKRHLMKAESPYHEDLDEETGVHHLAHAAWNILVALHNVNTRPDLDDRYKTQVKKEKK